MNTAGILDSMIESRLLGLHTAFIAKIVSMQGESMCSVQPLNRIKAVGKEAQDRAIITSVPILNHVRHYRLAKQSLTILDSRGQPCKFPVGEHNPHPKASDSKYGHIKVEPLKEGDIVFCVCADRSIAETRGGSLATPPQGHHSINDAVVVGLLGEWKSVETV